MQVNVLNIDLNTMFDLHLFFVLSFTIFSILADDPLGTPEGYLKYDIKKGASLNPKYEAVAYWNGSVFGWTEYSDEFPRYKKLFLFEGFNIRSVYQNDDESYVSLSREVSVYRDVMTGDILEAWTNIYSGEENEVFEVANDPVNALLYPDIGMHSYSQHHTTFSANYFLDYPNPLQPDEYPLFSSGEQYIGGEMFITFTRTENLLDEALSEVGYIGSWSRIGPWLPWLQKGMEGGGHLYNAPYFKLGSVDDIPEDLYLWTIENYPEYLHPPRNYTKPNMTSWRVFKNIIDTRRSSGEPDIQVPEQPEKGDIKEPFLDDDFMDHLVSLGDIKFYFEGTSYFMFEGQTGQEMLWMDGNLTTSFVQSENRWMMKVSMAGQYSTPWPEKTQLSGQEWINPEGNLIDEVPFIQKDTEITSKKE